MKNNFRWASLVLTIVSLGATCQAQVWTSLGPSPLAYVQGPNNPANYNSGRLASIAVDPIDLNHWLIGAGNGGVWETIDAGTSWIPLSDSWPTLSVGAVAFAPSDPKTIYVGTGEPDPGAGSGFAQTGLGMFKSSDGGRTWTILGVSNFARAAVKRIRVHPSDPKIVLAGTSRSGAGRDSQEGVPSSPPFGLLRSLDGGITWTRTLNGQVTALEIDAGNFNNQYAAIGEQRIPNGVNRDSADAAPNGLYRSTNGGQSWTPVNGPWGVSTTTRATAGRIELAMAPSNPNVMYASIQIPPNGGSSGTGLLGLYRTDDAWGQTPTWIRVPTEVIGTGGFCGPSKCGYSHVITVDPSDSSTLFAGGGDDYGFWRCTNCGASPTWTRVDRGVHPDYHATAWAGNRLIVGNDGGVWSTIDLAATWQDHNSSTLSTGMFYNGALHPTNRDFIVGSLRDFSLSVRTQSNKWLISRQPAPDREWGEADVAISSSRPDTDWAANHCCADGKISRTMDGGITSIQADAGIERPRSLANVSPLRKCPGNDDMFLTGTDRLWRTDNFFSSAAPSWVSNAPLLTVPAGAPATSPYLPLAILEIAFFAADKTCNTYAYGNRVGQVRLTRDGGKTWVDLDPGKNLPARPVNGIAFDPTNPNVMYVAISSFNDLTPTKPGHVFKTTTALGSSPVWANITPPGDVPYDVIAVDPRNPNWVYAGTDLGLWFSANAGLGWQRFGPNTGLPNAPIYDLKINPGTNMTVAFTFGRGAFSLDTSTVPSSGPIVAITSSPSTLTAATGNIYSQKLIATGGSAPYTWSLTSGALPPGLTLSASGILSGVASAAGSYTFTVAVTDSTGGIASQTVSLTVVSSGNMTRSGVLAQIAAGGGWTTVVSLNNTSASPAIVTVVLHAEDGSTLNLPGTITARGVSQTATAATFVGTIDPNGSLVVSLSDQASPTAVGWAEVLSTGTIGGFAIFRFTDPNGQVSEGTVALQTPSPARLIAAYDNTAGFATGVAIANLANVPVTVSATISDQNGSHLGVQSISVPASGHTSFYFPERLGATTGKQGIVIFQSSSTSGITAVGLRFSPFGTFTSVPTTTAPTGGATASSTRAGVLAQIASGGGWGTVISLNNTSTSPVTITVVLRSEEGTLLRLAATVTQQGVAQNTAGSSFTGTINPNATLLVSMQDPSSTTAVGWAEVLTNGPIGGFAIFRFTGENGSTSEGTVPLQTQFPSRLIAPYDNTVGFATGVAIANLANTPVTITAAISDQDGTALGVQSIAVPAVGHVSFYFPERLVSTTARQGIVTFQTGGTGGLTALGLRFSPFGTFTSVPTLPQ